MKSIKNVCVIGAGLMGKQIALCAALNGFTAVLNDSVPAALTAADAWIDDYLTQRVKKGKLDENAANQARAAIRVEESLEAAVQDADLVIEAILEDQGIKETLFQKINTMVSEDTIIATNSSFMQSSIFKDCVAHPERLANLHFFNPALVMELTEVVSGDHTAPETVEALMDFSRKLGKSPVWVRKEINGFIANRIVRAVKTEACYLLEEGIATAEEIDTAIEKGLRYPMGPFRLMDFTGVDLSYLNSKRDYEMTGIKPPAFELMEQKYKAGEWGKKTGKGWYTYSETK